MNKPSQTRILDRAEFHRSRCFEDFKDLKPGRGRVLLHRAEGNVSHLISVVGDVAAGDKHCVARVLRLGDPPVSPDGEGEIAHSIEEGSIVLFEQHEALRLDYHLSDDNRYMIAGVQYIVAELDDLECIDT